jgi:hypothetical protein
VRGRKSPWVASVACWRNGEVVLVLPGGEAEAGFFEGERVGVGMERISMGIWRRWHANIVFMSGMYCAEWLAPEEMEMWRIRERRDPLTVPSVVVSAGEV